MLSIVIDRIDAKNNLDQIEEGMTSVQSWFVASFLPIEIMIWLLSVIMWTPMTAAK